MAKEKPGIPKGTRDFGPQEVAKRKYILNTIEQVFIKYGFMPIETPTMENLSTLTGKYGDEGDKLLFNVLESGNFFKDTGKDIFKTTYHIIQFLRKVTYYLFEENAAQYTSVPPLIYSQNTSCKDLKDFLKPNINTLYTGLLVESFDKNKNQTINAIENKIDDICNIIHPLFLKIYPQGKTNKQNIDFQFNSYFVLNESIETLFDITSSVSNEVFNSQNLKSVFSEKGLRYDLTVPFARYVVMHQNEITFPFKRYQMQPVWRADKPQKGRYREFWQCDADVVGSDSLLNELDLIQIYHEAFSQLNIPYELRINNRKILAGIAEVVKGIEHLNTIAVAIDKLDKIGTEGVSKELSSLGFTDGEINTLFEIIAIKGSNTEMLSALSAKLQASTEGLKGIEELLFILNLNQSTNEHINLKLDFSLARGLSYYTGCIFEVAATEGTLKSSIGGGGRYDNLTGIFGLNGVSGVGISFGLDRIYDVIEELNKFPAALNQSSTKVLVCCFEENDLPKALQTLKQLREANIAAEIYADKVNPKKPLEKPIKYATGKKIPYALLYNIDSSLTLKNLSAGTQENLGLDNIISQLK